MQLRKLRNLSKKRYNGAPTYISRRVEGRKTNTVKAIVRQCKVLFQLVQQERPLVRFTLLDTLTPRGTVVVLVGCAQQPSVKLDDGPVLYPLCQKQRAAAASKSVHCNAGAHLNRQSRHDVDPSPAVASRRQLRCRFLRGPTCSARAEKTLVKRPRVACFDHCRLRLPQLPRRLLLV